MASISINPLTFGQRKLFIDGSNQPNVKEFYKLLNDLGQWANQIQQTLFNPIALASILNGNARIFTSACAKTLFGATYTVTTNPTIECAGSCFVGVYIILGTGGATSVASAVTLAHLDDGVPVQFTVNNNQTNASTYSLSSTNAAGTSRGSTIISFPTSTAGSSIINITAAQTISVGAVMNMFGQASNGVLWMVA